MKLYVGDGSTEFANWVTELEPKATLATNQNIIKWGDSRVLYTSNIDVTHINFLKLILQADEVFLYPDSPKELSDFCSLFLDNKKPKFDGLELVDERHTVPGIDSQIWAMGCSYTSAVGVTDQERWPTQLAKRLNKPVTVLAAPRASISWAADQLLRSNLVQGDTVFWMLTTAHRIDYYSEQDKAVKIWPEIDPSELDPSEYDLMMKVITHKWMVSQSIKSIVQVVNYCNLLGVDLYIGQAMRNDRETDKLLINGLNDSPNFIVDFSMELFYDAFMLDLGTDDQHPGPKTHTKIAEVFYKNVLRNK